MPGMPSRSGMGPYLNPRSLRRIAKETRLWLHREERKSVSRRSFMLPKAKRRLPFLEPPFAKLLFPQTQLLDQRVVPRQVLLLEVGEQAAALVDHHQQATAGMVILVVVLEVLGQVADALRKDRDLDFRRAGVTLALSVVLDDFLFLFGGNRHSFYSAVSVRLKPRTTLAVPPESSISATGTWPALAK